MFGSNAVPSDFVNTYANDPQNPTDSVNESNGISSGEVLMTYENVPVREVVLTVVAKHAS